MNLRPKSLSFRVVSGVTALAACALSIHCGSTSAEVMASSDNGGTATSPPPQARGDAGAESDFGPGAPNAGAIPTLESNLLLVNASRTFPAFRICPSAEGTLTSASSSPPQPTTLMPQSSLAGVDVNGAAPIAPQRELAEASEVLLLKIDDDTKGRAADLERGTCASLACGNGAGCLGANKIVKVPILENGAPAKGAFASTGKILALRGTDADLRFEVLPIANVALQDKSAIRVEYRNLSDYTGKVEFRRGDAGSGVVLAENSATELQAGSDYGDARFVAGALVATMSDVHQASNPRATIEDFYRSPGTFALLLTGVTQADAGAARAPRFTIVPVSARETTAPGDAGSD